MSLLLAHSWAPAADLDTDRVMVVRNEKSPVSRAVASGAR